MIEQSVLMYLKEFILKSGEELDWNSYSDENVLSEVKIIKQSVRTFRVLGVLTLSLQTHHSELTKTDSKLDSLAITARKKVYLDDQDRQTFKWLEDGWIIKEVRFEKDEKTVHSSHYRMGFRLYKHEQIKIQHKMDRIHNEFHDIKDQILSMLLTQIKDQQSFSQQKEQGIQNIIKRMDQFHVSDLMSPIYFPEKWLNGKRLKFLHFVHAFSKICVQKNEFDWKEIGANYYQKIGGSKEFDAYKQEFIELLEEWVNYPAMELGLTSLGQITPIYFAGQLRGNYASYNWGPVHALTNISISNEVYRTKATTLWLVENRAILTRMASAEQFLEDSNSLIICVDGHLRSAHRKTISQILDNSYIEQVMIWCDYDSSGLQISKEISIAVNQHNELRVKWILPDQQVVNDWIQYEKYVLSFLENSKMEQEQMIGGIELWKKWILD
ncbi:DUF2399 domain-containing protein [Bacillus sp. B1-b2]|uniref:DUF2399 domain-containing protein n=1 Tax=Bacillus sp. B1-b2 TaxID=2653201 RepID=UPI00126163BA|nr:DUF2399 domain-containing protein [Bacillus sp. B1-b2]KAB7672567.1 DUF2399 domain-containing protein [Bacillus sp. B1-b2]